MADKQQGWRKYFKVADNSGVMSPISGKNQFGLPNYPKNDGSSGMQQADFVFRNYASRLPEVYSGHPNRVERYNQYENMDMDSEINACLDIIAEFSTQMNEQNGTPFEVKYNDNPTDHEIGIIKKQLQQWVKLNKLDQRIFKLFRNTIKYGDQVFVRDPQTFEMMWVDMSKVMRVIVNESEGKRPEQYVIRDINPNFQNMTVAAKTTTDYMTNPVTGSISGSANYTMPNGGTGGGVGNSRFMHAMNEATLDAKHIVHCSLNEGLDVFWPFGRSVLEQIYKVYKQKELLEDAILIYRVSRAPERRIFKIDVGNMPSHMAMAFVERIKNEIHQRRIPTQTGGGTNMMDATYNPLSTNEDFFFPTTADGRGSSVETLPGGQNLGEITDLHFFTNKLFRGLRIPSSYLPTGLDDGASGSFTDGKVGTALIQEWRFNQYCLRLQKMIIEKLDKEFKMFMRWRGVNIDGQLFEIKFNDPQNFAQYRQAEVDMARINTFTQLEQFPYMSKRFLMTRFLGLSEAEMADNERMWAEEQGDTDAAPAEPAGLRSVGVSPGGIQSDLDNVDVEQPEMGAEGGMPDLAGGDAGMAPAGAGVPGGASPMPAPTM